MAQIREYLNRRLTGRDTVVVILVVLVLAGLGYAAYNFIAARILEARVNAALPKVCVDIRAQRQVLVKAIEAYKTQFGVYPPDHVLSRQPLVVDAVTNWLAYELVGVIYKPASKCFELRGMEPADAEFVKSFFHCDGFRNCAESESGVKHFLQPPPSTEAPLRQFHDDPDVYALGFDILSELTPMEVLSEINVSPWRYVSSAPTNNPGKFDLWIELKTKTRSMTIGNWKTVE